MVSAPAATPGQTTAAPVHVVVCEDAFLRAEALERFRRHSGAPPRGDLNAEEYDFARTGRAGRAEREDDTGTSTGGDGGGEVLAALLQAARTLPMMAKRRLVHGRNLEALAARHHPALLAYLAAPAPTCLLLLSAGKLDARLKLGQALRATGVVEELSAPAPRELVTWLQQRAQRLQLALTGRAAAALADRVGNDLGLLDQALQTLRLYAGPAPAGALTETDVAALVAPTREANIFALTQALSRREVGPALVVLAGLLDGGTSPLVVLSMVARQVRLLLAAKRWRGAPRAFADSAGVRAFVAEGLLADAKRHPEANLLAAMRAVQQADLAIKTGGLPAAAALQRIVCLLGA